MLSIKDVPDDLETKYKKYKTFSRQLFVDLKDISEEQQVFANIDLLGAEAPKVPFFILEGFLKLIHQGKTVRLYTEADCVILEPWDNETQLVSDFASRIAVFDQAQLKSRLLGNPELLNRWVKLIGFENQINLSLCAFYIQDDIESTPEFKQFNPDEIITTEGEAPDCIFEMISGQAVVLHDGQEIGQISEGEIFGEISFLTDSTRTATVKASSMCFVRIVTKSDFFKLIETNPYFIISIAKTLARRVVQLNEKVVRT